MSGEMPKLKIGIGLLGLMIAIVFPPIGYGAKAEVENIVVVRTDRGKETINRNIYGHFSEHLGGCIYGGYWVGEDSSIPNTRGIRNDVVEALKNLKIPVLRWPGGCFADEYHWQDGIGPKEQRPPMVNTHWGMVIENNHFGTHEFLDLCEQLGCEPYICGNVGSGSVLEMQQWVEYLTFAGDSPMAELRRQNGRTEPWRVMFWGIGNENWGCGGSMTPEYYAGEYRRYQTYLRSFSGNRLYKIACGASGADYNWTEVLLREAAGHMDGMSIHYYCGTGSKSNSATEFEEVDWFSLLQRASAIEEIVQRHSAIMDKYDPQKRIGLLVDEWGTWHAVEPGTNPGFLFQQNTLRDALVAGLSLNVFNRHCDRVKMTNIAQTVNVLQAMILTDREKMVLTPTYHVFEMYKVHQDAQLLPSELICRDYTFGEERLPALSVSASKNAEGVIHLSVCNLDPNQSAELECRLENFSTKKVTGRILTAEAMNAHNTFDQTDRIHPKEFKDFSVVSSGSIMVSLPEKSVVVLAIH